MSCECPLMKDSLTANRKLIAALVQKSSRTVFRTGYTLFRQGESPNGVYVVCSGSAYLGMKSESGAELLSLAIPAGSLVGLAGIFANECHRFYAVALPGSEIRFISRLDFEELVLTEPTLYPMLLRALAADVNSAQIALLGKLGTTRAF